MIKFPTTLSEYTKGKLWHNGVNESIARRILVGLDNIDDKKERDLRKMYLAHFYCETGNYSTAMTIVKQFLLESVFVEDSLKLMKRLCLLDEDFESFSQFLRLVDMHYDGVFPDWVFEGLALNIPNSILHENFSTNKGRVVFRNGMDEYYNKSGKLIFRVKNKDYDAFVRDSAARFLINDNDLDRALELLEEIDFDSLTSEMRRSCKETYIQLYCELKRYDDAFECCREFLDDGIFLTEMPEIFLRLYQDGSPKADILKEFLMKYKGYSSLDMCDIHSIANEINDMQFWSAVYANNPLDAEDKESATMLLRGILYFNDGDYDSAEKIFCQLNDIFGNFGMAKFYKFYIKYYLKYLKKPSKTCVMSDKLFTARIDEVYSFIDKKMMSKLKKINDAQMFAKNLEDNLIGLDNMLCGVNTKVKDILSVVNNLYKSGSPAATDIINRAVVGYEYDIFTKAICLANFLMYSKQKKYVLGKNIYRNYMPKLKYKKSKENLAYGIAIYYAFIALNEDDEIDYKKVSSLIGKIYNVIEVDYTNINPYAVFGVLFAYIRGLNEVKIDGQVVRKRDVKDLVYLIIGGLYTDYAVDMNEEIDPDVYEFILRCSTYI